MKVTQAIVAAILAVPIAGFPIQKPSTGETRFEQLAETRPIIQEPEISYLDRNTHASRHGISRQPSHSNSKSRLWTAENRKTDVSKDWTRRRPKFANKSPRGMRTFRRSGVALTEEELRSLTQGDLSQLPYFVGMDEYCAVVEDIVKEKNYKYKEEELENLCSKLYEEYKEHMENEEASVEAEEALETLDSVRKRDETEPQSRTSSVYQPGSNIKAIKFVNRNNTVMKLAPGDKFFTPVKINAILSTLSAQQKKEVMAQRDNFAKPERKLDRKKLLRLLDVSRDSPAEDKKAVKAWLKVKNNLKLPESPRYPKNETVLFIVQNTTAAWTSATVPWLAEFQSQIASRKQPRDLPGQYQHSGNTTLSYLHARHWLDPFWDIVVSMFTPKSGSSPKATTDKDSSADNQVQDNAPASDNLAICHPPYNRNTSLLNTTALFRSVEDYVPTPRLTNTTLTGGLCTDGQHDIASGPETAFICTRRSLREKLFARPPKSCNRTVVNDREPPELRNTDTKIFKQDDQNIRILCTKHSMEGGFRFLLPRYCDVYHINPPYLNRTYTKDDDKLILQKWKLNEKSLTRQQLSSLIGINL